MSPKKKRRGGEKKKKARERRRKKGGPTYFVEGDLREKADYGGDQGTCADMSGNVKPLNRLLCGQTVNILVKNLKIASVDHQIMGSDDI
jgi:hypothetical protein